MTKRTGNKAPGVPGALKNCGEWLNECRPIIESNGELLPGDRRYQINATLTIAPGVMMTPEELERIAYFCSAIANTYKATKDYIRT